MGEMLCAKCGGSLNTGFRCISCGFCHLDPVHPPQGRHMRDIVDRLIDAIRTWDVFQWQDDGAYLAEQAWKEIQSQADEIEALRKGLEPFARAKLPPPHFTDDYPFWNGVTAGDFRKAVALLKGREG